MQFNIELTIEETNRVLAVLSERPFKEVADLIGKIKGQADMQFLASKDKKEGGHA